MNMIKQIIFFGVFVCCIAACKNTELFDYDGGQVRLNRLNDSLNIIEYWHGDSLISEWKMPHEVYQFDYGDLNNDSVPEIVVGVIKSTRYWRKPDKRLFIFKLYQRRLIRPLWLGSHVGVPLVDFRVCRDSVPARIITVEHLGDSIFSAQYKLAAFGLDFEQYLK